MLVPAKKTHRVTQSDNPRKQTHHVAQSNNSPKQTLPNTRCNTLPPRVTLPHTKSEQDYVLPTQTSYVTQSHNHNVLSNRKRTMSVQNPGIMIMLFGATFYSCSVLCKLLQLVSCLQSSAFFMRIYANTSWRKWASILAKDTKIPNKSC
ncbi:hypothetical protein Adt_24772 [Abeliophyllum distichum]|uniref:Uncharacterized protein n=1 Tax=Abeliophyllum distichum TaxID=126358 RepID=A0ABD1SHR8_9LAMI